MKPTTQEKVILDMLKRAYAEYQSMERNEYAGTEDERNAFRQHLMMAEYILARRIAKRGEDNGKV